MEIKLRSFDLVNLEGLYAGVIIATNYHVDENHKNRIKFYNDSSLIAILYNVNVKD